MSDGDPAAHGTSSGAWLSDDEAHEVARRLQQIETLLAAAAGRREDHGARPPGARLFEFVGWIVPIHDED